MPSILSLTYSASHEDLREQDTRPSIPAPPQQPKKKQGRTDAHWPALPTCKSKTPKLLELDLVYNLVEIRRPSEAQLFRLFPRAGLFILAKVI
ncbi:hypothetical protein E2C01_081725 [Portunus trituberculatus]|uniref:Uncharacterized protein n=1 Tax=Portunus trituberculatus TaxID=210409 RepID=A0A5B7IZM4_PORTR|nr:hypothetical protein [Portunus trituberculatus]